MFSFFQIKAAIKSRQKQNLLVVSLVAWFINQNLSAGAVTIHKYFSRSPFRISFAEDRSLQIGQFRPLEMAIRNLVSYDWFSRRKQCLCWTYRKPIYPFCSLLCCFERIEVTPRTATKFLSPLLPWAAIRKAHIKSKTCFSCVMHEGENRIWCAKIRSIKPKIRRKAKKSPDVWQGWHQAFEVQQALIALTQEIISRFGFLYRIKSVSDFRKRFFYLHNWSFISSWEKI